MPSDWCACFFIPKAINSRAPGMMQLAASCLTEDANACLCSRKPITHAHPSRCTETLHADVWEWIIPTQLFRWFSPLSQSLCQGPASSSQWLNYHKLTSNLLGWHGADCIGMLWLPLHLPLMCYWWLHHRRIAIDHSKCTLEMYVTILDL